MCGRSRRGAVAAFLASTSVAMRLASCSARLPRLPLRSTRAAARNALAASLPENVGANEVYLAKLRTFLLPPIKRVHDVVQCLLQVLGIGRCAFVEDHKIDAEAALRQYSCARIIWRTKSRSSSSLMRTDDDGKVAGNAKRPKRHRGRRRRHREFRGAPARRRRHRSRNWREAGKDAPRRPTMPGTAVGFAHALRPVSQRDRTPSLPGGDQRDRGFPRDSPLPLSRMRWSRSGRAEFGRAGAD